MHVASRGIGQRKSMVLLAGAMLALVWGVAGSAQAASVTIIWTAPGDDGNVGQASQYDVRYSTSTIDDGNWDQADAASGEPAPEVAGSPETFTLTGLLPNTTYYFAIKTADEADNWSALSNVVGVTTNDDVAPAAIVDLTAGVGN